MNVVNINIIKIKIKLFIYRYSSKYNLIKYFSKNMTSIYSPNLNDE